MQQHKPVGVGVIGYGYWSPKLIRNIESSNQLSLVGICEKDESRHALIAKEHPDTLLLRRYQDLFALPEIDAVIIATIPSSHYRIAKGALEAGKHVFVEKPLALTVADAQQLCSLAKRMQRTLMVDHTYLYSPAIQTMGGFIKKGTLGKIYSIESSRVNLGLFQRDTNVLWDLAPHDFAIILSLIDERPSHVAAIGSKTVVHPKQRHIQESDAHINLFYTSGLVAHVHVSWTSPIKVRQLTVIGSEKMAQYDQLSEKQLTLYDQGVYPNDEGGESGALFTYKVGETSHPEYDKTGEDLARALADFATSIQRNIMPYSNSDIGLEVVRILCAAERSMRKRGVRIPLAPNAFERIRLFFTS